ncbi:transposase, IS4 family protein [Mesorhizobium amorphae CCNWGS0123]|uniref:Transposase, IS4 family protein n=1 Tax=Mesorhizobium amorphae CCNWGS0123 TaxID=1082933 RepID=G6YMD3_9HYPH|nr:hypothetical protein [Mesorhizobium amorphae]ANT54502.1 hypothetical protein A6B35_31210 [Mesorhizobium amorphae CCNWGS0123]EHH02141.1 transposase, IS4 family protein [Mesorhizobium amorphae CCNWGS0123]
MTKLGLRLNEAKTSLKDAEAEKDKADHQAIVEGPQKQLKKGDKALIGNKAHRRYLKSVARDAFEIDLAKLAQEARYAAAGHG